MDKDFRSLEHKIRDLMMETMARNSAKRMQIANVGRPTDTDDKSKLAKQAEIKTKVIDEEVETVEEAAPKWDEKEFKLVHPGKWKHTSSDSSIHYGGDSKSYRVMHGNDSDPKKYNTLDGAQKAVRAKHVKEEVEEIEEGYTFKKTEGKKWEGVGFGSTPAYHELHADGKATGITVGGTKGGSYFVKKDGKHVTSSSSMDFAKKAAVDHHKGVKEEVEQIVEKEVVFTGSPKHTSKKAEEHKKMGYKVVSLKKHKSGIFGDNSEKHTYKMAKEEVEPVDEMMGSIKTTKKAALDSAKKAGVTVTPTKKDFSQLPKKRQDAINGMLRRGHSTSSAYDKTKHMGEEVEQIDEISSALLHRAKQAAQKKAGWLMPGDKGKGDKAWGRVRKFRDAGVAKEKQERAKTNEEVETVEEDKQYIKTVSPTGAVDHKEVHSSKAYDALNSFKKRGYKATIVSDKTSSVKEEALDEISKDLATRYKEKVMYMPAADQDKESPHKKIKRMIGAARAISKVRGSDNVKVHATEEVDPPVIADKKKDKDKGDMDDKDAKMIKGGKTEVNLEPKTDDRPEEASLEDSKSKKASKDENKKIGAKSGVKEETMSHTPFGLPQGLIDAVNEALKGGQKKLDKNHNGKLDGQDFKMLRKEEAVVEDEQIDELSKDTLQKYVRKASSDAANHAYTAGAGSSGRMNINRDEFHAKASSRLQGISKAAQKLAKEEVEEIEELSKATVKSYYNKGREQGMAIQDKMKIGGGDWSKDGQDTKTLKKRTAGHQMALRRRHGEVKMSEEAQLSADELARIEAIAKGLE